MKKTVKRILVVKPSSLGDILHVFPALELLHRNFPGAVLDYLVHPAFAEILDYSPEIDTYLKVTCFPTFPGHCGCILFDISEIEFVKKNVDTEKIQDTEKIPDTEKEE